MKKLISLLVFASILGYVGQTMATQATHSIGSRTIQIEKAVGE